jgi:hypothetical protein
MNNLNAIGWNYFRRNVPKVAHYNKKYAHHYEQHNFNDFIKFKNLKDILN